MSAGAPPGADDDSRPTTVSEGTKAAAHTTSGLPGTPTDDERDHHSDGLERAARPVPTGSGPDDEPDE